MSKAGAGKPNRIVPTNTNGPSNPEIPDDLVWDADNPPIIYPCSQDINHAPFCKGDEDGVALDSELQIQLMNEGRAWARLGMSFQGIPAAYQGVIPRPGIAVELVDLLSWMETMRGVLVELSGMTAFDFEEKFREFKLNFLREIRLATEERVKKERVVSSIGIVEKPGLLGPDGQPLG